MNKSHTVTITARQIYTDSFDPSFVVDGELVDYAFDLGFEKEEMIKFECSCGKTFRKRSTVTKHMIEVRGES